MMFQVHLGAHIPVMIVKMHWDLFSPKKIDESIGYTNIFLLRGYSHSLIPCTDMFLQISRYLSLMVIWMCIYEMNRDV